MLYLRPITKTQTNEIIGEKKTMRKKLLALLLTLCMLLSISAVAAGAEQAFTDVSEDAWYSDAVNFCYYWNLMNGTGDNKFSPNTTLTRGMIVTILHRWEATPDASGLGNPFSDVPEGTWYTDAVKWAAANNIVNGYGDGKFGPNDPVTKEQLALLIYRISDGSGMILPDIDVGRYFDDIYKTSVWAYEAVSELNKWGVFVNLPGNSFGPQTPATRAEVASILYRYIIVMSAANDGLGE